MADRGSAELFGSIFETLADKGTMTPEEFWAWAHLYDFHPHQMGCDDALIALKLAIPFVNEAAEDMIVYANRSATDWDTRGMSKLEKKLIGCRNKPRDFTDYAAAAGVSL